VRRRTFLKRSVGWALAGVAAPMLDACTRAASSSSAPTSASTTMTSASASASPPPSWASLENQLNGALIRPGSSAYPNARLVFDPLFDAIQPRGIVMAENDKDVAASIAFARDRGMPFTARSGGHSYGGYSVCAGLVIDVSSMRRVRATGSGTAEIGAGTTLIDVAAGLARSGVMIPGGTCGSVGISGLTMGGGQGVTGRRFGLTCDSLTGATVVTADGRVLTCDLNTNADLFWAIRGGGGGNFGVVTSFTFKTHAVAQITDFSLSWPWTTAADVLDAWQAWGPTAAEELWSSCRVRWVPSTGPSISVGGAWLGVPDALGSHLDDLANAVGVAPSSRSTSTMTYLQAALSLAGCSGHPVSQCRLTTKTPPGILPRQASIARSDFFDHPMSSSVRDHALARIEARASDRQLSQEEGGMLLDAWGGHIAQIGAVATAFPHRDASFLAQEFVTFRGTPSSPVVSANRSWLNSLGSVLRPSVSGYAYVNYIDPTLKGWQQAYYGSNLDRLIQVKRTYDPDDAFTFAQSIPTST
jgi:FAD binding domain/Berberine and berberine like